MEGSTGHYHLQVFSEAMAWRKRASGRLSRLEKPSPHLFESQQERRSACDLEVVLDLLVVVRHRFALLGGGFGVLWEYLRQ
jgi:hypothetical protein